MTSPAVQAAIEKILRPLHPINSKKMFGGVGIFSAESGNMFALISSRDVLYFKVDANTRPDYESLGMEQFHNMPYFKVPEQVLSDDDTLRAWVGKSADIAARSKKPKRKKRKSQS